MIRFGAVAKTWLIAGVSSCSEVVKPGTSALVESVRNRSTPSSPRRAKWRRSVIRSSSGNWSIRKSPVCSTSPASVRIATARLSGIEWLTATNSHSNGPALWVSPASTWTAFGVIRCSLSLDVMNARVSSEPMTGMSGRSLSRYGTPPMWSSWPWVSTMPTMSPNRCRMEVKSGRITSMPGWCSSGNSTPQSTTSSLPACSKTVMLRPISPRPPSGVIRRPPEGSGGGDLSLREEMVKGFRFHRGFNVGWSKVVRAARVEPGPRPGPDGPEKSGTTLTSGQGRGGPPGGADGERTAPAGARRRR